MNNVFPLILCLIPVHSIYAQNIGEIKFKTYIDALIKVSLIILISNYITNLFINNIATTGIIFSIAFFAYSYGNCLYLKTFSPFQRTKNSTKFLFLSLYLLVLSMLLIGTYSILHLFPSLSILISKSLFYISSFITFFVLIDIYNKEKSLNRISKNITQSSKDEKLNEYIKSEEINKNDCPDIYHIILDSHSGFDNPKLCDHCFKAELEKRGFHICKGVKSNYTMTGMSLPSMLHLNYVDAFFPENEKHAQIPKMWQYYNDNTVFKTLKKLNYKFICAYSNFFIKNIKHSYIDNDDLINKIKASHERNEILFLLEFFSISNIMKHYTLYYSQNVDETLNIHNDFCSKTYKSPTYYYAHILAPHTPYLKNENGEKIHLLEQKNIKNYMTYQKYINKTFLKNIDTIQKNMKDNSIIILHSDHSICYNGDTKGRYNILCAIYSKNADFKTLIPDNSTLVNIYRYIFNKLFNANLEILPNKYFQIINYKRNDEHLEEYYGFDEE